MKRWLLPSSIALLVFAGVFGAGVATWADGGYRAPGLSLLDAAGDLRKASAAGSLREGLAGPAMPGPLLVTAAGVGAASKVAGNQSRAAAAAGAAAIGLAAALLVLVGWRLSGLAGALGTAAALLCTPGTLFHARVHGPEATIVLAYSLLLFVTTWRSRGVAFAAASTAALLACLASTHEAILMVVPLLWCAHFQVPKAGGGPPDGSPVQRGLARVGAVSPAVFVPVLAAPLLLVWLWPHLDGGGVKRLVAVLYEPFAAQHPPYLFLGEIYDQSVDRGPNVLVGLAAFLLRLPLVLGALAVLGAVRIVRAARARQDLARAVFAVGGLLTLVLVFALNGSPYYRGTDGFASALPFVSVLAGVGLASLAHAVRDAWPRRIRIPPVVGSAVVCVLVLGPAVLDLARSYPMEPAYHSSLIGGSRGAAARGMELRTDAFVPVDVLREWNYLLPRKASVAFVPGGDLYRPMVDSLRRHGLLREDIESAAPYHASHIAVPRLPAYPQYQTALRWWTEPLSVWEHDGVRHLALYEH